MKIGEVGSVFSLHFPRVPWDRLLRLSLIDWLVVCYVLPWGVLMALCSPLHLTDRHALIPLLSIPIYLVVASWYRQKVDPPALLRVVYQLLPVAVIAMTYFRLRHIIPQVNSQVADAWLANLDQMLFGIQGSVWLERWATFGRVEWFSACYQSYIYLGTLFLLGEVILDRDPERKAFFGTGVLLTLTLGHLVYLLVPARGPLAFLESLYAGPLPGGGVYQHVVNGQQTVGPIFDAFPSLHTASTLFLCLFIHQHYPKFRWPVWALTLQIIFSTVFLRYHYVIDVFAGIALVSLVYWASPRLLAAYQQARSAYGLDGELW